MKKLILQILFLIIFKFGLLGQSSEAWSQINQLGIIDFYGNYPNETELRKCLPFKENDTIHFLNDSTYPLVMKTIVNCLMSQSGIRQAEGMFVCCEQNDDKWIVFIGVDTIEKPIKVNSKLKDIRLGTEIKKSYDSLMNFLMEGIEKSEAGENNSMGHSLSDYSPARLQEEKFIKYANKNLRLLREVLMYSKYTEDREVAATVIAYYKDKRKIINDLLYAVADADNTVRNNVVRAIGIIANYSQKHPELNINVPADPFIEMINSISWTDRNKSGMVLLSLTNNRNKLLLDQLKRQALKPILDMARWKSSGHSYAGFTILGRIADWTDQEIWDKLDNDREKTITEMLSNIRL